MKLDCTTLVLDLDGTISDPSLGITRCFNHALKIHGFYGIPDKTITEAIGPPLDETFLKLVPDVDPSHISSLVATYRERYAEFGYAENLIYQDIPATLTQLQDAGIRLGVCTSKRRDFAEKILSLFKILDLFDFVDGGDIGITKKEQLSGLLEHGLIDDDAIMVGDRAIDIVSAKENGLRSIGVLWGFGSHEELSMALPTRIIDKVTELSNIVI